MDVKVNNTKGSKVPQSGRPPSQLELILCADAANGGFEPNVTDAAGGMDVRTRDFHPCALLSFLRLIVLFRHIILGQKNLLGFKIWVV